MPRFRRYRVFLIFAVFIIVIVVRLRHTRDWAQESQPGFEYPPSQKYGDNAGSLPPKNTVLAEVKDDAKVPTPIYASEALLQITTKPNAAAITSPQAVPSTTQTPAATAKTIPHVVLPDRKLVPPTKVEMGLEAPQENYIYPAAPPGRQELPTFSAVPTPIHWEKQIEHFPIPAESLILLPTGPPVQIAKIQHAFRDETVDAKITREKRQLKVKEEFQKAWSGYKKNAWLHDELSPVSGKFRDPFCGWAATLVDTLDTLWIMGLQEEFEEAAKAVDLIDFTTSPRADIPMFETTIRYLGGLLAAYDVSDHQYKNLLDKAVELGEVLMGAFDTPNRMPLLYYRWKPTFSSQPHRASTASSLAELGSLSMEFTRLAQLTGNPKYYDAIARVTNALSEWQDRGTQLDGVFPDNVDASGCNRTALSSLQKPLPSLKEIVSPAKLAEEPIGFQPLSPNTVIEPRPIKKKVNEPSGPGILEMQILPGEPSKAEIIGLDDDANKRKKSTKRDLSFEEEEPITRQSKKEANDATFNSTASGEMASSRPDTLETEVVKATSNAAVTSRTSPETELDPITGLPLDIPAAKESIGKEVGEWDCPAQGLEPSYAIALNKFSMGGGQDSTYEYFTKQYLLLGGLDNTYRKMYLKTIDTVRKYMLYRPMLPDSRDILFSGSVTTAGLDLGDIKLSADVEHLTCFIGGMVGMSAKIFGLEGDLEIAKKLTDGCVWAYESMTSGIMPEGATVMPCESAEHCSWNETAYWEFLDPAGDQRDKSVKAYEEDKVVREAEAQQQAAEAEAIRLAAFGKVEAEAAEARAVSPDTSVNGQVPKSNVTMYDYDTTDPSKGTAALKNDKPVSLQKRHTFVTPPKDIPFQGRPQTGDLKGRTPPETAFSLAEQALEEKAKSTEAELAQITGEGRPRKPPVFDTEPAAPDQSVDPLKPLGHMEYVQRRIKQESLPPGFVTIKSKKYILRPEAIESVWYMYRITGDDTWQNKGWKMFESIIAATSTEYGHSAIYDVTLESPFQVDEMESFWLAETLKYFYLLYSTPDTISLDDWVLNTEAHPFKRPS